MQTPRGEEGNLTVQTLDISVTDITACPACGGGLQSGASEALFYCSSCGIVYPENCGVADFAPRTIKPTGLGQRFMEDRRVISIYETRLWRGSLLFRLFTGIWIEDEIALVSRILAAGPEDTVLDISCGTGLFSRAFALGYPGRRVIGLDICSPMLDYAREKAFRQGLDNITFVRGDAHFLPFRDSSMDAVNCAGALHLLGDPAAAMHEAGRVIKQGGRFAVAVFRRSENELQGRFQAAFGEKVLGIHPFSARELTELFDAAGFDAAIHHARGTWLIASGTRR